LTFTGGEPFIRSDFLSIYSFALKKGFIVTIFTNGQLLNAEIVKYLVKYPPYSIEITLNGITRETYESITQVKDSFSGVIKNIRDIRKNKLPLIIKSNCLKQNQDEIPKIKAFSDKLLGKDKGSSHFKYDPMIYPRINGDSCQDFRLSFEELHNLQKKDPDIWQQYSLKMAYGISRLRREKKFLYNCTSWKENFFVDPSGRLKFCYFSQKFSTDLKRYSFNTGFYKKFSKLLYEKFKTKSKCKNCRLRPICYHCPARAYLETGNEEAPVPYYCKLAKGQERLMKKYGNAVLS